MLAAAADEGRRRLLDVAAGVVDEGRRRLLTASAAAAGVVDEGRRRLLTASAGAVAGGGSTYLDGSNPGTQAFPILDDQ